MELSLKNVSYDKLLTIFGQVFIKKYGERDFFNTAEYVKKSPQLNAFIQSKMGAMPSANEIVEIVASIDDFFSSTDQVKTLASIFALKMWDNDINSHLDIAAPEELKSITIKLITDLDHNHLNSLLYYNTQAPTFDRVEFLRDFIFFPESDTTISKFKMNLFPIKFVEIEDQNKYQIYCSHTLDRWLDKSNLKLFSNILVTTNFSKNDNDLIMAQTLSFESHIAAMTLFKIFELNEKWSTVTNHSEKISKQIITNDGKIKISLLDNSDPFDDYKTWFIIEYDLFE